MGGISEYAMQVEDEKRKGRRRPKGSEKRNVPPAVRDAAMDLEIQNAIKQGLGLREAETAVLAWNARQPSPAAQVATRQRIFEAYKAANLVTAGKRQT